MKLSPSLLYSFSFDWDYIVCSQNGESVHQIPSLSLSDLLFCYVLDSSLCRLISWEFRILLQAHQDELLGKAHPKALFIFCCWILFTVDVLFFISSLFYNEIFIDHIFKCISKLILIYSKFSVYFHHSCYFSFSWFSNCSTLASPLPHLTGQGKS